MAITLDPFCGRPLPRRRLKDNDSKSMTQLVSEYGAGGNAYIMGNKLVVEFADKKIYADVLAVLADRRAEVFDFEKYLREELSRAHAEGRRRLLKQSKQMARARRKLESERRLLRRSLREFVQLTATKTNECPHAVVKYAADAPPIVCPGCGHTFDP